MKIVGALFIIISSVFASYTYEKREKSLILELKEIKRFANFIRIQIEHFSLSLNEIFAKYDTVNETLMLLMQGERVSHLGKDVEQELFECFSTLGTAFKSDEVKRLTVLIDYLEIKIQEHENEYKEKTKVFRTVALFIGFSVVILLV